MHQMTKASSSIVCSDLRQHQRRHAPDGLKALVWQDESGTTWISYNDPAWLAKHHGLSQETDTAVSALTAALAAFAKAAVGPRDLSTCGEGRRRRSVFL
jgi:hypothetical protein